MSGLENPKACGFAISYFGQWVNVIYDWADAARIRLFERLHFYIEWQGIIEGLIIVNVVFMPVLSSWWLLLPLFVLLWASGSRENHREPGPGWLLVWLVFLTSAFFSPGFTSGFPVLLRFGSWFGLAWLTGRTLNAELMNRILKYLAFTSPIWLIISFGQLFSGIPTPLGWLGMEQARLIPVRIYSVFGNPNLYALYLLIVLVVSVFLLTQSAKTLEKFILSGITGLTLAALYFTYTRMAWLLAMVYLVFWPDKNRWRRVVFMAGMVLLLFMAFPDFNIRLRSLTHLADSSLQYRLQIWRGAWEAVRTFWLWGVGPGSFQAVYPQFQIGNTVSQHAHQLYLQLWLEHGITGLLAFLAVLNRLFRGCWRAGGSPEMKTPFFVLVVFLVYGLSETWYIQPLIGGYFWFFAGLLQASKRIANSNNLSKELS